ncbi:GNAT family N-acetyltransferase [Staphylococcus sp. ACRSN]|uniref:GNAT family N-acetyltransferase n=1 Tax=Staphylococcus sp. ACRSN TaxID=2918214 RepID=UPI001EF16442|nr:GNAT family N-acetyltransferase [Staphylococcus sp. ACRSN]MCG7339785.1 GNAT family N-acetyltransferase [Staphylococcus sp. ACRSN]
MNFIKYSDKEIISKVAQLHENELEKQEKDYKKTALSIALREEMILSGIYHGTDALIVETSNQTLIGVIWGRFLKGEQKVITEFLYVALNYRRQGIASSLKDAIEDWAIVKGASQIQGTVSAQNVLMQQLNIKKGYHMDKVIMTKNIPLSNEEG